MNKFLFKHLFLVLLGICLGLKSLGPMVTVFTFLRSCHTVFQSGHIIYTPSSVGQEVSGFSTSCQYCFCLFSSCSGGCEVVSNVFPFVFLMWFCLHFPNLFLCFWATHVPTMQKYLFKSFSSLL